MIGVVTSPMLLFFSCKARVLGIGREIAREIRRVGSCLGQWY
jgi:hypothetical protein